MLQELFRVPFLNIPIFGYGLMVVIGFVSAMYLARFLARRTGLDPEVFSNAALLALVAGIVGARLSHVLENFSEYTDPERGLLGNLAAMVNIRSGGLTYYGGFLLAFPTLVWYAMKKKIPVRLGMDIVAPCLMVGLAFGRIGCFLNGCCYGAECQLPWAVQFPYGSYAYVEEVQHGHLQPPPELLVRTREGREPRLLTPQEIKQGFVLRHVPALQPDQPPRREKVPIHPEAPQLAAAARSHDLHPAQLYSAITAFLIAALCLSYFTVAHAPGRVFALMLMIEGGTRVLLEMLRVEPVVLLGMSYSMVIGLGLVVLGVALWMIFGTLRPRSEPQGFEPLPA